MTYRQAKQLIAAGDVVYIPANGRIVRAVVSGIYSDHLVTDKDVLFYDEVGTLWFLTLKCAVEALKEAKTCCG